jgi:hypothetical protein
MRQPGNCRPSGARVCASISLPTDDNSFPALAHERQKESSYVFNYYEHPSNTRTPRAAFHPHRILYCRFRNGRLGSSRAIRQDPRQYRRRAAWAAPSMPRGRFDRGHAVGGCSGGTSRVSAHHWFVDGANLSHAALPGYCFRYTSTRCVSANLRRWCRLLGCGHEHPSRDKERAVKR